MGSNCSSFFFYLKTCSLFHLFIIVSFDTTVFVISSSPSQKPTTPANQQNWVQFWRWHDVCKYSVVSGVSIWWMVWLDAQYLHKYLTIRSSISVDCITTEYIPTTINHIVYLYSYCFCSHLSKLNCCKYLKNPKYKLLAFRLKTYWHCNII